MNTDERIRADVIFATFSPLLVTTVLCFVTSLLALEWPKNTHIRTPYSKSSTAPVIDYG